MPVSALNDGRRFPNSLHMAVGSANVWRAASVPVSQQYTVRLTHSARRPTQELPEPMLTSSLR
jgi:hypothetical protein